MRIAYSVLLTVTICADRAAYLDRLREPLLVPVLLISWEFASTVCACLVVRFANKSLGSPTSASIGSYSQYYELKEIFILPFRYIIRYR